MKQLACLSVVSCLFFSVSYAQSASSEALEKELISIQTWQAQFSEEARDAKGQLTAQAKGVCALKRPGYFFWKVTSPNHQTIYINPKNVWMVDDDLAQATQHDSGKMVAADNPVKLLIGPLKTTLSQYHVTRRPFGNDMVYRLTPLHPKRSPFQRVMITIHKGRLSAMDVTNSLSGEVLFHFTKVRQNQVIPNAFFKYVPADGVDVIREGL